MKKLFIIRLAVLGTAIVTASAFTKPEAKPVKNSRALEWFVYTPGEGGQTNPANYSKDDVPPSCNGMQELCAIQALEDGDSGRPIATGSDSAENPTNQVFHQ
ncbi:MULTISPECIES: hypothetical protein [Olivibacter]|uniref:Uncharacterized protein n=1 Tax=Olivibacter oleidegradans TaxID=760123 RepID=A0ABV6HE06_9SPHI